MGCGCSVLIRVDYTASEKEILDDYPDLEAEDIKACLQYAAAQGDHAVLRVP